jgi:ATP-dependent DNA helicase RecQ
MDKFVIRKPAGDGIQGVLESTFKLKKFRGQQLEIIKHIIDGNDALVLMPTGSCILIKGPESQ